MSLQNQVSCLKCVLCFYGFQKQASGQDCVMLFVDIKFFNKRVKGSDWFFLQ